MPTVGIVTVKLDSYEGVYMTGDVSSSLPQIAVLGSVLFPGKL